MPPQALAPTVSVDRSPAEGFWEQYEAACVQEDRKLSRVDRDQREHRHHEPERRRQGQPRARERRAPERQAMQS